MPAEATTDAILIGGSAGALEALIAILPQLPRDGCPAVLVLHITPTMDSHLVEVFSARCRLRVKEAEDKEQIERGTLYIAPPDYHLLVERSGRLSLSVDEPVHFSRPAIDVLFESAAVSYGDRACGVLLSGANEDGARGLARIQAAGGLAIVQSPESSAADAMPRAALARLSPSAVLSPIEIGTLLGSLGEPRR